MRKENIMIQNKKPLFTTKHHKAIEEVLNGLYLYETDESNQITFWQVAGLFRELFEKDNSKFEEQKFRKAIVKE